MTTKTRDIEHGAAKVQLWAGAGDNVVRFSGVIREEHVQRWLAPLIAEIHQDALSRGLTEVMLDLRELQYANAATWRCLLHWIKRIRSDPSGYVLRVIADPGRPWQSIALPAWRVFTFDANGVKRVIIEPDT